MDAHLTPNRQGSGFVQGVEGLTRVTKQDQQSLIIPDNRMHHLSSSAPSRGFRKTSSNLAMDTLQSPETHLLGYTGR